MTASFTFAKPFLPGRVLCFNGGMQPLGDIVLIKADNPKEKTASGIYLKEEWKTLPPTGEVLAIGPDVSVLSVGDRVLFERYASIIMEDDQRLCKETHILAIINDKKT